MRSGTLSNLASARDRIFTEFIQFPFHLSADAKTSKNQRFARIAGKSILLSRPYKKYRRMTYSYEISSNRSIRALRQSSSKMSQGKWTDALIPVSCPRCNPWESPIVPGERIGRRNFIARSLHRCRTYRTGSRNVVG